jgi:hypothetical protein
MHQADEIRHGRRDCPGDEIISEVEDGESLEPANIGRNISRDPVSDKIQDSEKWKRGDTTRNLARNPLPISDDDRREARELADIP